MATLIHFLSDMLKSHTSTSNAQADFVRDPEATMAGYGLTDSQKDAVRSRDVTALAHAVSEELASSQCEPNEPNW